MKEKSIFTIYNRIPINKSQKYVLYVNTETIKFHKKLKLLAKLVSLILYSWTRIPVHELGNSILYSYQFLRK